MAALYGWLNQLLAYAESLRPVQSLNTLTSHTAIGTVRQGLGESAPEPGNVLMVKVVENLGDYVTAYEYDAASDTTTGSLLKIAKPWRLRRTTWDGTTYRFTFNGVSYDLLYTYTATDYRSARDVSSGTVERQAVIPVYKADNILFATEPTNGTGVFVTEGNTTSELTWLDLNIDARAWCRY